MSLLRKRTCDRLSVSNCRWTAYATAAAATGFAAAGIATADAEIHYSGVVDAKFIRSKTRSFPLDPAGLAALQFSHFPHFYSTSNRDGGSAFVKVLSGSVAGYYATCASGDHVATVSNLSFGETIAYRPFVAPLRGGALGTREGLGCGGRTRGQFLQRGTGFIAFRFDNGSGDQYGWARVRMKGATLNEFILVDYAYGDPGDRIKAGQTSSSRVPTVESLGGLALGATGLFAWRQRHTVEAK